MGPVTSLVMGIVFEGIFYGSYCLIFCLYLQIQLKTKNALKGPFVYALTVIFILCTAFLVADMIHVLLELNCTVELCHTRNPASRTSLGYMFVGVAALYTSIDLISQGVLIYRCWMMWRRLLIVALPVILALAYLGTSITGLIFLMKTSSFDPPKGARHHPIWFDSVVVTFFSMSLAVNAGVTSLIVLKILIVYREHQRELKTGTVYANGRVILYKIDANASPAVYGVIVMLHGISSTIVHRRVVTGLSYTYQISQTTTSNSLLESNDNQFPEVELTRTEAHAPSEITQY